MRLSEAVEENGLEIEVDIFNTRENSSGNLCLEKKVCTQVKFIIFEDYTRTIRCLLYIFSDSNHFIIYLGIPHHAQNMFHKFISILFSLNMLQSLE